MPARALVYRKLSSSPVYCICCVFRREIDRCLTGSCVMSSRESVGLPDVCGGRGVSTGGGRGNNAPPPPPSMEAEKRIRREIANSNERRRMQSINAGFQSLRTLLPHHEGEKLSKVSPNYPATPGFAKHLTHSSSYSPVNLSSNRSLASKTFTPPQPPGSLIFACI